MNGMAFDVGSVIGFTPIEPGTGVVAQSWLGDARPVNGAGVTIDPVIGWGVVVVHRSQWVGVTRIEPMVVCCGSVVPLESHGYEIHGVEGVVRNYEIGVT